MANDIRTRPTHKDIKILDRTEAAISHIKDTTVKTKDTADKVQSENVENVQEYASDKVTHATETAASGTAYQAGKIVKSAAKSIKKRKEKTMDKGESFQKSACKSSDDRIRSLESNRNIIRTSEEKEYLTLKTKKPLEIKGGNETIKTMEVSGHAVVKTSGAVTKQMENAKKLSAIAMERARQAVKYTAKTIEMITKKAVIIITSCIKAISAALSSLIAALGAGGSIAAFILVLVVVFGGVLCLVGGGNANAALPVSAEVEAYEPLIRQYATQHGISEYVELIKAVMMQESGGRGLDPMQSSEGNFNTSITNIK